MNELPINWPEDGLIPAVIQNDATLAVLMVGFMNAESLQRTIDSGEVHFWSRSRNELWHKGGSSGHVQKVRGIFVNCDQNSLLIKVEQIGAVCHDGYDTCYYRELLPDGSLEATRDRLFDPRDVYGDGFGLAGLTQQWWRTYEYLQEQDFTEQSGTSRILREDKSVLERVRDELHELAGVLDGTHIHEDQRSDFLLEASQCCYWIVLESLLRNVSWTDVRPDRALDVSTATVNPELASLVLRAEAEALRTFNGAVASHLLHLIAESARTLGIDPREIIERDLAELQSESYLAAFFAR